MKGRFLAGFLAVILIIAAAVPALADDYLEGEPDEIDTGISGSASQKVGYKLKALSKSRQVICITHQAQIASLADEHLLIQKKVEDNRTFTQVTPLDFEQRKQELARIIGGVSITEITLQHAEEMLKNQRLFS